MARAVVAAIPQHDQRRMTLELLIKSAEKSDLAIQTKGENSELTIFEKKSRTVARWLDMGRMCCKYKETLSDRNREE